jgi:hypothetical protein
MTHVLVCLGSGAGQEWTDEVMNLGLWLIEVNTHPSIQKCILKSLTLKIPIMEIAASLLTSLSYAFEACFVLPKFLIKSSASSDSATSATSTTFLSE